MMRLRVFSNRPQSLTKPGAHVIDDPFAADPRSLYDEKVMEAHFKSQSRPPNYHTEKITNTRNLMPLGKFHPIVSNFSFVAPNASVIGQVVLRARSNVWYNTVIKGDMNRVYVGGCTAILENSVISSVAALDSGLDARTSIGNFVVVGSGSIITAARIHSHSIIGSRSVIGKGAIVEPESVVAAGSIVPEGKIVGAGEVWGGNPIGFIRKLGGNEKLYFQKYAEGFYDLSLDHWEQFLPLNKAYYEKVKLDSLEADELADLLKEVQKETEAQDQILREKLEDKRKEFAKTGALGEAF